MRFHQKFFCKSWLKFYVGALREGILQKFFYERRDYESVNEKSLSYAMSRKTTIERIQAQMG